MKDPFFSIIIPTFNRKKILEKCLNAILEQKFDLTLCEIIVIDDGSDDDTVELIRDFIYSFPTLIKYFRQNHKGPATARNKGIKNSRGEVVLFTGDDIIWDEMLLKEHYSWHKRYPEINIGVLGLVKWDNEIEITPFMKWLDESGLQFHFGLISDKTDVDPRQFCYTPNLSIKREFFIKTKEYFDEDFEYAAFEDIELGYRLKKKNFILKFNKKALSYHHHNTTLRSFCKRMKKIGESTIIFASKTGLQFDKFRGNNRFWVLTSIVLDYIGSVIMALIYFRIAKFNEKRKIKKNIYWQTGGYYRNIGIFHYRLKNKLKKIINHK